MVRHAAVLLLLVALAQPGRAQQATTRLPPVDSARVVALQLTDGSELLGRVVEANDSSVTVVTAAGLRVVVPRGSLASWRVRAGTVVGGRFLRSDPNTSRLFLSPTARTLPAGSGYFADYYLFFPMVGYGLMDRITVAGGMSIFPGAALENQIFYLAPKIGLVRSPSLNVAAGLLYLQWKVFDLHASGGVAYGVATVGGEDREVTVGLGWPFAQGQTTSEPMIMVGGEARISSGIKLMGEVWKLPGASQLPGIFGLRFFGDHVAVDFGLLYIFGADMGNWPFLPWVDFVVNW